MCFCLCLCACVLVYLCVSVGVFVFVFALCICVKLFGLFVVFGVVFDVWMFGLCRCNCVFVDESLSLLIGALRIIQSGMKNDEKFPFHCISIIFTHITSSHPPPCHRTIFFWKSAHNSAHKVFVSTSQKNLHPTSKKTLKIRNSSRWLICFITAKKNCFFVRAFIFYNNCF